MSAESIQFENVSKGFCSFLPVFSSKENYTVFEQFNLSIAAGERVLIRGENGVGKTTLLKMICGLSRVDGGNIFVGGKRITQKARAEVGVMMGHLFLYPKLTVRQNLEYNARVYGLDAEEVFIEKQIHQWKLSPFLDKQYVVLSHGQKTLAALARANLHEPRVLLLDEPHVFLSDKHLHLLDAFLTNSSQTILYTTASFRDPSLFTRVVDL